MSGSIGIGTCSKLVANAGAMRAPEPASTGPIVGWRLLLLGRLALRPRRRYRAQRSRRRILGLVGGRRGRRRAALARLDHPQLRHVAHMLLVGLGEDVAAGAIGDEEQLARARRIGSSLERGAARIGDRSG